MTSAATNDQQDAAPAPPPPAEITYSGQYSVNPLAEVSFRRMCAQIPAVLGRIARLSWRTDRRAVQLLLGCQLVTGIAAAVLLTATAHAMRPVLGDPSRARGAGPACGCRGSVRGEGDRVARCACEPGGRSVGLRVPTGRPPTGVRGLHHP